MLPSETGPIVLHVYLYPAKIYNNLIACYQEYCDPIYISVFVVKPIWRVYILVSLLFQSFSIYQASDIIWGFYSQIATNFTRKS
jgi:hypothetical protein